MTRSGAFIVALAYGGVFFVAGVAAGVLGTAAFIADCFGRNP